MKLANKTDVSLSQMIRIGKYDGKILINGREYVKYDYHKNYFPKERVAKFFKYIIPTLFSCGLVILFSTKYARRWNVIAFGNCIKQILHPKKVTKIYNQTLNSNLPIIEKSKVSALQNQLDLLEINLNCETPDEITKRNHFNKEEITAYLNKIRATHPEKYVLFERLFNSTEMITFEELQVALASCTNRLDKMLAGQDYSIGFVKNKSQKWLAELALPGLSKGPSASFENATETLGEVSGQTTIASEIHNLVIFDDASYSGKQLCYTIEKLKQSLASSHGTEPCNLYLIVPFISKEAEKKIHNKINLISENKVDSSKKLTAGNLKVHLITTDKRIKSVNEALSEDEVKQLADFARSEKQPGNGGFYSEGFCDKCLTFTEWKTADDASIPSAVKLHFDPLTYEVDHTFVTNFLPPYKQ